MSGVVTAVKRESERQEKEQISSFLHREPCIAAGCIMTTTLAALPRRDTAPVPLLRQCWDDLGQLVVSFLADIKQPAIQNNVDLLLHSNTAKQHCGTNNKPRRRSLKKPSVPTTPLHLENLVKDPAVDVKYQESSHIIINNNSSSKQARSSDV